MDGFFEGLKVDVFVMICVLLVFWVAIKIWQHWPFGDDEPNPYHAEPYHKLRPDYRESALRNGVPPNGELNLASANGLHRCGDCGRYSRTYQHEMAYLSAKLKKEPLPHPDATKRICPHCGRWLKLKASNDKWSWLNSHPDCLRIDSQGWKLVQETKHQVRQQIRDIEEQEAFEAYNQIRVKPLDELLKKEASEAMQEPPYLDEHRQFEEDQKRKQDWKNNLHLKPTTKNWLQKQMEKDEPSFEEAVKKELDGIWFDEDGGQRAKTIDNVEWGVTAEQAADSMRIASLAWKNSDGMDIQDLDRRTKELEANILKIIYGVDDKE